MPDDRPRFVNCYAQYRLYGIIIFVSPPRQHLTTEEFAMTLTAMTCLLLICICALVNIFLPDLMDKAFTRYESVLARNAHRRHIMRIYDVDQMTFISAYMHMRLIHYTDAAWGVTGTVVQRN